MVLKRSPYERSCTNRWSEHQRILGNYSCSTAIGDSAKNSALLNLNLQPSIPQRLTAGVPPLTACSSPESPGDPLTSTAR